MLTLGFITPLPNSVLMRVDSEEDDYIEVEVSSGNVFVNYNLGLQDIAVGETNVRADDGKYHVLRFTRSGANSTLQLDDNQIQTKHVTGET